jgi:two-component system, OmpR family, response regulator
VRQRILVVEDDEDVGSLLLSVLRDEHRDVFLARDLETAKALAGAGDMHVIVLDVALPRGLEGLRFLDWYYANAEHRAKVIVLSALGREILDEVREDARVAAVMSKPFAVENLVAAVEGLLTS